MLVKVSSVLFFGLDTRKVDVEVDVSGRGLPSFDIVGLAAKSVEESRHRIKAAFLNSGYKFPDKKITVNLAPADVHKEGCFYDLPIAVGIYASTLNKSVSLDGLFFGEISLNGDLRGTKGSFLVALYAKECGYNSIYVPSDNLGECSYFDNIKVYGVRNLKTLFESIQGQRTLVSAVGCEQGKERDTQDSSSDPFSEVIGQEQLKRALEISAAGGHNLMMVGPPGSGKTMAAKLLPRILPHLTEPEAIEVTKIWSYLGKLESGAGIIKERPFRNPHHTVSYAGLVGGGFPPIPGEISLAHRGVLFLDEVNEFNRNVLEALRQPIEEGEISICRGKGGAKFPCKFTLIVSRNPCPCGYYGSNDKQCKCGVKQIERYNSKLSGPIMDRIDIHIHVRAVETSRLISSINKGKSESASLSDVRLRVLRAREVQLKRLVSSTGAVTNAEMGNSQVIETCFLNKESLQLLKQAQERFKFSARAYFKILKVARTIADLKEKENVSEDDIAEAVQYRADP